MSTAPPTPDAIMQLGTGFWASKTLLSAVELGLFSELAKPGTARRRGAARASWASTRAAHATSSTRSWRSGCSNAKTACYRNTPETDLFLDRAKPSYAGGLLEMLNARLFGFWNSLTEGLRTGEPQNEAKTGGNLFDAIYSNPDALRGFAKAMTASSYGAAQAMAATFPWDRYKTVIDIGCAEGCVPVQVALAHEHMGGGGFDLPVIEPHLRRVRGRGRAERSAGVPPGRLLRRRAAERRRAGDGAGSSTTGTWTRSVCCSRRPTRRFPTAAR